MPRKIRVLLAKLGLDAHTIGVNVIAQALRDAGMEVIYTGLRQTPEMVARTADRIGIAHIGIGSDLCQDQPDSVVEWMRIGRWTKAIDYGEGSAAAPGFPPMPHWFGGNRDFGQIAAGLAATGMDAGEVGAVMGGNWMRFFEANFTP